MPRLLYLWAVLAALFLGLASSDASSDLMKKLVQEYKINTLNGLPANGTCTPENMIVRKEWYAPYPASGLLPRCCGCIVNHSH
jgi:hypothetical protein